MVVIYLAVLTIIEVVVGSLGTADTLGILYILIIYTLLALAFLKAILVAGFFMGIKYERLRWYIILGTFGLPMFLALPVALIPILG
ncbi:MAG: cytochrome C oxidase subunit IV family protein [Candidatus Hodarchaeota archaeon]